MEVLSKEIDESKIGYGSPTALCLFVIGLEGKVFIISGCGVMNINPMDKNSQGRYKLTQGNTLKSH